MDNSKKVLTLREVAEYLDVHPSTIYKYAQNGQIPAFKIGSDWRFRKDDIDAWIKGEDLGQELKPKSPAKPLAEPRETPSQTKPKTSQDIAVVGMACHYPGAHNIKELWENILAKRVQFRRMLDQRLPLSEYFDENPKTADKIYASKAAYLDGFEFDWSKWRIPKKTFESTDIVHWLALETALKAFEDAGYKLDQIPNQNTGVILGNTLTGEQTRSQTLRLRWPYVKKVLNTTLENTGLSQADRERLAETMEKVYKSAFYPITEDSLAGGLANTIAGRICNFLNFKGGGYIVDGACSSSLLAVATAADALKMGNLDLALAGGVDISLDPFELVGFSKAGALAKDKMRVYDKQASGFIPGEGCGFIVLKRLEDAVKNRDYIYAVIKGWGISSDGKGGIMEPSSSGQSFAIQRAYKEAGYKITDCDFVEGHGTGTTKGDRVELEGIASAVKKSAGKDVERVCGVTSFKSIVGHTKAAAGIGGLLKAILAVNQRILPPTANCQEPNEVFDGEAKSLYPLTHGVVCPRDKIIKGGVSAAGFGGINCHIALQSKDQPSDKVKPDIDELELMSSSQQTEVFVFASRTIVHLQKLIKKFKADLRNMSMAEMADLAARLNKKVRAHAAIKVAIVTDSPEHLYEALCLIENEIETNPPDQDELRAIKSKNPNTHILLGNSVKKNRIGFLYPGQASQRLNMTRILVDRYQWARDLLKITELPIDQYIYKSNGNVPKQEDIEESRKKLSETQVTQPAVSFSSLAWSEFLSKLGVEPNSVGGHSLGEITAFYKAGAFNKETLLKFAEFRGEAMAAPSQAAVGMVSLFCSHTQAKKLVDQVKGEIVIANINSPNQQVISGGKTEIENVIQAAKEEGVASYPLPVSNAFHSRFMEGASKKIEESKILPSRLQLNGIKIYSCIDGKRIKEAVDLKEYFAKQVLSPVHFTDLIKSMSKTCDLFIEVGPGRVLSDLVKHINKTSGPACIPVEGAPDNDKDLNIVLAELFVRNVMVNWEELYTKRLIRPFIPASRRKFLMNQCERPLKGLDEIDMSLEAHKMVHDVIDLGDQFAKAPPAQTEAPKREDIHTGRNGVAELLLNLVHKITGFETETITFDLKLLDDLNLDSIKAAELIAEAAKSLGLTGEIDPSQYSNSTLGEIRDQLKNLLAQGKGVVEAEIVEDVPHKRRPQKTWVRNFTVEYKEQKIEEQDPGLLNKIKNVLIICEESGLPLSEQLKKNFQKTKADVEVLKFDEIDERVLKETESIDCVVSLLPVSKKEMLFGEVNLKHIIQRLHKIVTLITRSSASKDKTIVFAQFGGGELGEDNKFRNIESCSARSFASTLQLEKSDLRTKIVDFDQSSSKEAVAKRILEELQTPGTFSIAGYDEKLRRKVPVYEKSEPVLYQKRNVKWSSKDVVLVTGGAKGITAECALEFARKTKARMVLVGRSPLPGGIEENSEITATLNRFKKENLKCHYYQCDITNYEEVENLIKDVKKTWGKVTGVVHGAGLITLKRLEQTTIEEAYKDSLPKVVGAINLCQALEKSPPKMFLGLTSVIGVTGMEGSGWYGVGNEIVNLYLTKFWKKNKNVSVATIAYSIWDEVGMGVRLGSVDRLSYKGIHAIPREEGVQRFQHLVEHDPGRQQVVVVANMAGLATWNPSRQKTRNDLRFIEDVQYILPEVELLARAHLNVTDDSYLLDHNWKGSLLFPLVFGLEAMAQAYAYLTGVDAFDGLTIKDIKLERPIPVNAEKGTTIEIHAEVLELESPKSKPKVKVEIYSESTNFSQAAFSAVLEAGSVGQNGQKAVKSLKSKMKKAIDLNLETDVYGRILFQGKMFRCINKIYDLFYNPKTKKGECLFDAEYCKSVPRFLKGNKRFKTNFLIGDPFFIDSMFHSMQLIISQDLSLPNYINKITINSIKASSNKIKYNTKSGIKKINGDTYIGNATAFNGSTVLNIQDCRLKVLEHLSNNPSANDIVNPGPRDQKILEEELAKISKELDIKVPVIKCLYDSRLRDAGKAERHKIEMPLIKEAVREVLGNKQKGKSIKVKWLKSGKPVLEGKGLDDINISLSHDGDFLICVAGHGEQGCDVETIKERSKKDWLALLGKEKYKLAEKLCGDGNDINNCGTAVWGAAETATKVRGSDNIGSGRLDQWNQGLLLSFSTLEHCQSIATFSANLTKGYKKNIAVFVEKEKHLKQLEGQNTYSFEENSALKILGYNKDIFGVHVDYSGPQKQVVFSKQFPVTFKTNQLLSRRVYFTNFFDWMGEVREYSAYPIMDKLATMVETGSWGIATNLVKLQILGELRGNDVVEVRLWMEDVTGAKEGTFDLCFEWRRKLPNQNYERIAFSQQRVTWIKVTGHGEAEIDVLPKFIKNYMNSMKPRTRIAKPLDKLRAPFENLNLGSKLYSTGGHLKNKPLLKEEVFATSLENSNLIGNIYFSNYAKWLGKVMDSYSYGIMPEYYAGIGEKGEFLCLNCEIKHLSEAMPFDDILVRMYLASIYECGIDLHFEYYLLKDNKIVRKLAYAEYKAVWTKRTKTLEVKANKLPNLFLKELKKCKIKKNK